MDEFRILGGEPLHGIVKVGGAKNSALPLMAASILTDQPIRLEHVPRLADVDTLSLLLAGLGVESVRGTDGALQMQTVDETPIRAARELVRQMRASFCVLGPLLARRGRAIVPLPGGCNIGPRPVDLHLKGLAALGAELDVVDGDVVARAADLRGAAIDLGGPGGSTVTGTANVLCAAVLARGETILRQAAREPEIADLGHCLNAMGARIAGLGTSTLRITGVGELHGTSYRVIPDRIEAATLAMAAAITRGSVTLDGVIPEHFGIVIDRLRETGCNVEVAPHRLRVAADCRLKPVEIVAEPYPGIPTDVQAQWIALLSLAKGRSTVRDRVFPGRFQHVPELNRLGADVAMAGETALVHGVARLHGRRVTASDLRASAALVLAGLAAEGETIVDEIHHLDRGYEKLDDKLRSLGAAIRRTATAPSQMTNAYHRTVTPTCGP
ncbi:MAG: UDP-N-acetylglucosamine 1-carboxyvinyltransferase [Rhodopirellula sp.]|nr:UDP-N-acetylglucosamine 1-carboxyvinyltransferase [Rhodopirellula sp.]